MPGALSVIESTRHCGASCQRFHSMNMKMHTHVHILGEWKCIKVHRNDIQSIIDTSTVCFCLVA